MAGEIEIKLKGLREVRQELKVLQFELSQATDPEQMAQLSQKAGELRDNLSRANEQAAVFAAGSPFEQTNNALGLMSSQIMSLDFEGAAESAKLFATAAKGINGQLIATQLKSLGSVVMSVGKAFLSMGAALLTNPIFLIAAAIVGIVTVIGVLLNKLGLLKPILNAVGAAFKVVKDVIMGVVQALKDFLDWLGLTSFAAEEAAERQAAAQEKVSAAYEDKRKKLTTAYDQEIVLANIAGENTSELERKKQQAIIETSRQQYKALEAQRDALRAAGKLTAEQSKQINETMRSLREGIEGARFEIKKLNAQEVADTKKKNEEVEKADKDSYAKRIEAAKKYGEDRLAAQRLIRDLELELMQEGITKDLEVNTEKYARLIADTQKNEKLLASEKTRIIAEYAELQFEAEKAIRQKYDDELQAQIDLSTANRVAAQQKEQAEFLKRNEDARKAEKEAKDKADAEELAAAKAKTDALLSIEQSLYTSAAALGELFIKDSKKLERFQKAQALVQIGIDTAKAISALVAASQQNPANGVTGGLAGIAQFASGIAQILTNVAKAKQLLTSPNASASGGGGGGGGSSTSAAVPSVAPQVNLFGQGNNMNNLSAAQANEQSITVTAVVSETEITSTQNKIKGIKQMSEL
jgi:hypothetical protein